MNYFVEGEYVVIHVAFHPNVIEEFGLACESEEERDALIQLAINYLEDQHKMKLFRQYSILDEAFKGNVETIRADFGLDNTAKLKEDINKLVEGFGPVSEVAAQNPSYSTILTSETSINSFNNSTIDPKTIKIPGATNSSNHKETLIKEVQTTPTYVITMSDKDAGRRLMIIEIKLDTISSVKECELDITQVRDFCNSKSIQAVSVLFANLFANLVNTS